MPVTDRTAMLSAAYKVWSNPATRLAICQYASIGTLARILRVSTSSFKTGVKVLFYDVKQADLNRTMTAAHRVSTPAGLLSLSP